MIHVAGRAALLLTCILLGCGNLRGGDTLTEWSRLPVPGVWEQHSDGQLADYDGFAWYRCYVKVPAAWTDMEGRPLWRESVTLTIEKVADACEVYVNGRKLGESGSLPPRFKTGRDEYQRFKVPPGTLKPGHYNAIAVRVYNKDGNGGFTARAPVVGGYFLECVLNGTWQFRTGDNIQWAGNAVSQKPTIGAFDQFTEATSALGRPDTLNPGKRLPPRESHSLMTAADDLAVDQLLSEPLVSQPLFMNFDERGRLWLVQYRQYPYPAGIKVLSRNKYYRMEFDRVSPPPPNHFPGNDRISIHEDTDGDGRYDKHKVFVGDLNIATSVVRGRGGIWVLNPPYLLFYPDANNDDLPDSDPIVHLTGLGLSDTHSAPNSLQWGPDGWLYLVQGSNVVTHLKTPSEKDSASVYCEGPAVWRYHPETHRYEIFAEGGGNAFGLEIDAQGRIYSGHNGSNTRGFYYVQGGYYDKGTERKYGEVTNPYAFGLLPFMAHAPTPRFSHALVKYEADALPSRYQGRLFSVDPLHRNVIVSEIQPQGSSFATVDIGDALVSDDIGFRPVAIATGPDGGVYVADFYEEFIAHGQHYQGQIDPDSGRVYRLRAKTSNTLPQFDLRQSTSDQLIDLLKHPNKWHRRTALRLLADRRDQSAIPRLLAMIQDADSQTALEALWALNLVGGFNEDVASATLSHRNPMVRFWTVRLLGDRQDISTETGRRLALLAETEPDVEVRGQLAASARRLPPSECLAIVSGLLARDEDANDPFQPLMVWWALESKADSDRAAVVDLMKNRSLWQHPMTVDSILPRLMQRYATAGGQSDLNTCAELFELAEKDQWRAALMTGFEQSFRGRSMARLPLRLAEAISKAGGGSITLQARLGDAAAFRDLHEALASDQTPEQQRIEYAQVLGELNDSNSVSVLLSVLTSTGSPPLQSEVLAALAAFSVPQIADAIIRHNDALHDDVRLVAYNVLVSRKDWSRAMLEAIERGMIDPTAIPRDTVRKMTVHNDDRIAELVRKHWSDVRGASTDEMKQQVERLSHVLESETGNPYAGESLYAATCGKCHRLFHQGGRIGPDLTQYKRDDTLAMLLNIVNPSAEIREGFENYMLLTSDGRVAAGFLFDQDKHLVVIRGADGQNITIRRDQIEEMVKQSTSLMPSGLLDKLSDQQVRDLMAYIRSSQTTQ
ncbi:MAG: c-type cytochrome [Fuerstiella sp.]|nr:c-type cytochrome [Fuerstiella sp.]MCP4855189.1 c-type cytochrome [Fuerstiella sp.]